MRATPIHPRRTRWIAATVLTASVMALSVLGAGSALAAVPNWQVGHGTDSNLAPALQPQSGASSSAVSAGADVGFFEWARNNGPSNISQFYVNATTSPAATVAGASWTIKDASGTVVRSGSCPTATPLACTFGALRAGQTVYIVAAFTTGSLADGTTQSVHFDFNTSGNVPGGNNSHGDAIGIDDAATVTNNGDAAGDFNFNQPSLTVADNQSVSNSNKQATSVTIGVSVVGAAVGDSPNLTTPCNSTLTAGFPAFFNCSLLSTLTSTVEVGNGKTFNNPNGAGTPGIKVVILFKKAPSQLTGNHPFVYHYYTDATGAHAELVTATCSAGAFPTNTTPCLTVGNNKVTVWLLHNGNMRM
jgi:hypothetical protein